MIRSGLELKAAIEQAARDNPAGRHVFEIGEGLEPVGIRNLPFTGWVEIVGGSIARFNAANCGSIAFRGVRFFGQQHRETWGVRAIQVRISTTGNVAFSDCAFEAEGEPWNRPDGALIDAARAVRWQNCRFRGLYNGAFCRSVSKIEHLGGDFRDIMADAMGLRNVNPELTARVLFVARDNLVMAPPDEERAHPDAVQLTPTVPTVVDLSRNVVWTPGRSCQGFFLHTEKTASGPISGRITQNVMLIRHPNAVYAWEPAGLHVAANVIATELSRDPRNNAARIAATVPGMSAADNITYRLAGPIHDAGGNVAIPRGAYQGRLRGPWTAGEWGDVLASPPPLDAPASVIKGALRRALSPI